MVASDHNVPVYSIMETREVLHLIVGCGSLHVLWDDMAESERWRFTRITSTWGWEAG